MNVAIHPGLGRRRWIGLDRAGMAVRQIKRKEVQLLLNTTDHRNRLAKISLSMARRMRQRNEHLA